METATGPASPSVRAAPKPADAGRSRIALARASPAPSHGTSHEPSAPASATATRLRHSAHGAAIHPHHADRTPSVAAPPSASYRADLDAGVRALVATLAPALGLDPARVHVVVRPSSGPAHGAAAADIVTLEGAIDPSRAQTRALLLHELVHMRQHRNRGVVRPDPTASESEAAGLANALCEGRALWVPRHALPEGHLAHDGDAKGIAPASTPDVEGLERTLDTYVGLNHSADLRMIADLLDHPWTQLTEEMIENSLRILSVLRFVVARALVRALDPAVRRRLAQLRDSHHDKYPEACVAVLSALTTADLANLSDNPLSRTGPVYLGATTAFHGVDPTRLSQPARRALLATLRRLPVATLGELDKGDRRTVFHALFQSPPDTGTDEAELRLVIEAEKQLSTAHTGASDDNLYERVSALLRDASETNARAALTALEPACGLTTGPAKPADKPTVVPANPPTLDDLRTAVAKPVTTGTGSNAPPSAPLPLVDLVGRLDRDGLIHRLIDKLPEDDRRGDVYGPVIKTVLAARMPLPNLARATELLSYGIFDWKIFDSEARLAYLLVRSTPIVAQENWRQLDNGKWIGRLEDNLPDDMWSSGEYTGVGSEYSPGGGSVLGVASKLLQDFADAMIKRFDDLKIPPIARNLVRELLGLDHDGKPAPWLSDKGAASKRDPALRTAIIRRIDARARLDGILAMLPDDYLFGEQGRGELLDLNQLRDPVALMRQALALAPSGFGWLTFTHRDAWLAVQALRALPPETQQLFARENSNVWTILWAGLTPEMRAALPTTLATGRDERLPTRAGLRERISDERLWTEANADQLRALLDLAYAADDKAWVFAKSQQLRADQRAVGNPKLTALVTDLKLYSASAKRTTYLPERTPSSRAPVWGYALGVVARALGILAYDLFIDDTVSVEIFGKTMHLRGFDLGDVQTILGGDVEGIRLDRSDRSANKIDVDTTFEAGFILNVDLKDLEIAGVNIVLPGRSIRSGPISVKGLKASAGFSDRGYHDPAYVALSVDRLGVSDLVLIDPTLPLSGAWAVTRVGLDALNLRASQDGADDPLGKIGQSLPKGTIPVPVFGPLFQALKNIVALYGTIPGDYTLLDYALIPVTLPFGVSTLANKAFPTPAPLTNLWGLAADGVLRPPYSAAQRMKDSLGMLRAYNVSFASLKIDGISLGSGQQIQGLTLTDVNIGYGQSLPAYLNSTLRTIRDAQAKLSPDSQQYKELDARASALDAQLKNVEATPRVTALRNKREKDASSLTDDEKKELAVADKNLADEDLLRRLEAKDRWHPGSLNEDERKQLVELTRKLRSDVGVSAEIGSITLGPLSGSIEAAGVTLKGVHVQARLPNVGVLPYAPGYLDDKTLIAQFVKGGPKVPTIGELAKSSEFSLSIDETTLARTDPAQPAVVLKADTIPSGEQLQKTIDALPDIPGNEPIRGRLAQARLALLKLDRARLAAQAGLPGAEQRVRELTDDARRLLGIEIGGITFGRITGELNPKTGTLTATVHDAEITGLAGLDFAVDSIKGSLELGVTAGNVSARLDQLKGTDVHTLAGQLRPTFGLKGATATGIHLPSGVIGSATLGSLTGSLQTTEKGYRIPDLHIDFIELDEINLGVPGDGLQGTKARIDELRLDAEVEVGQKDPTAARKTDDGTVPPGITKAIIHSLRIGAISGSNLVLDMPQKNGSIHAVLIGGALQDISADDIDIDHTSAGWDVLKGSGSVGAFADVRYSVLLSSLTSGNKQVTGTLHTTKDAIANKRPTIIASYVKAEGRKIALRVTDLQALGTEFTTPDGKVTIRTVTIAGKYDESEAGARASATLANLVIGPIDWRAGTGRLRGSGPLAANQVTVAAYATPDLPAKDGKPAKKGAWTVTDVVITGLAGNDLRYTDPPLDMHLGRDDKPSTPGEAPLRIGRVHIQPAKGMLSVADLSVDFGGDIRKGLHADAHLGIHSLVVELDRGGHLVAVVKGVSADATVSGDYSGTVDIKGFQGATIDVGPDGVTIGSDDPTDPTGLRVEQISLSSLDITSEVGGHKFHLKTQTDGRVDLLGLRAKVRIDKWQPGEVHKTKSPWKQIAFERFYLEKINLGAFQVDLPDDDVTIIVPAHKDADPPTLHRLDLTSPVGTDPALLHPDFTINLETFALEGVATVTDIALPVQARIRDKFNGAVTLTTWTSSIGFLAGGGIKIDVEHPQATMAKAAELGRGKTIRVARFGADSLSFADGRLYVKGPNIADLEYKQKIGDSLAVWVKVKSANLKELNFDTAAGGSLAIPSLDIADAFVSLDIAALTAKDPKAADTPSTFDKSKLRPIVDQVNGTVKVVLYVAADVGDWKDIRIGTTDDPLVVPITKGEVDIPTFEKNIYKKVAATDIGEHWWYLRPWTVGFFGRDPMLRVDKNKKQLQLGVYAPFDPPFADQGNGTTVVNGEQVENRPDNWAWNEIMTWDLGSVDFAKAQANKFSLWSAIFDLHSEPATTEAQKQLESAEDKKKREAKEADKKRSLNSLELRSLVADLELKNSGPLPVTISSAGVKGSVTLSDNALMNLHVAGGLPAVAPPSGRPGLSSNRGGLDIGLDALKLDKVDLTLYDHADPDPTVPAAPPKITGLSGLKTGTIKISDLTDASLSFDDLFTPQRFAATIKAAHAENIRWFKY